MQCMQYERADSKHGGRGVTGVEKLQAIYDAERNIQISWFWDSGIHIKIGDDINGWKCETVCKTVAEAIDWAHERVRIICIREAQAAPPQPATCEKLLEGK